MGTLNIGNLSPEFIELNRGILEAAGFIRPGEYQIPEPAPAAPPEETPKPGPKRKRRYDNSAEAKLQSACRNGLMLRGYVELTPTNLAERAADARGWFGHMVKPQGNPIMPDLFIFDARQKRCLMVELKTHNVYQVGQKEMIDTGNWELATRYGEFVKILDRWEQNLLPGTGTGKRE